MKKQTDERTPWFKFEKAGDKVGGYIKSFYYKAADETFGAQRVFLLEQKDGTLVYAPLKENARCFHETDNLQVGDFLGIKLDVILEPSTPGKQGAKIYTIFPQQIGERKPGASIGEYKPNVGDPRNEFSEFDLPEVKRDAHFPDRVQYPTEDLGDGDVPF